MSRTYSSYEELIDSLKEFFNDQYSRERFADKKLIKLIPGQSLLDAGCWGQKYRKHCDCFNYLAQDFGGRTVDSKKMMGNEGLSSKRGYLYGPLDYVGNIWEVDPPYIFLTQFCVLKFFELSAQIDFLHFSLYFHSFTSR